MDTFEGPGPLSSFGQEAADDQSFLDFFQQQQDQQQQQGMVHTDTHYPANTVPSHLGSAEAAERVSGQERRVKSSNGNGSGELHGNNTASQEHSAKMVSSAATSHDKEVGNNLAGPGAAAGQAGQQGEGHWATTPQDAHASTAFSGSNGAASSSYDRPPSLHPDLASTAAAFAQPAPPLQVHGVGAGSGDSHASTSALQSLSRSASSSSLGGNNNARQLQNLSLQPQQQQQQQPPSIPNSVGTSRQSLHPHVGTPIRHNSLPLDPTQQNNVASHQQLRSTAIPTSRQMSTGSLGNGQNEGGTPGPPPLTLSTMHDGRGSPMGADRLGANSGHSQSPSPLRMSMPFSASPDGSGGMLQSPTHMKGEEERTGQIVPSQGSPYGHPHHQGMGTGSVNVNDPSGAASTKFVHKLFRMVSDPEYQHLISWNGNGTSVVVTNFDEFAKEVLGKHFKHSNFSSFIRQLNMYGFYKVNKTPRGHRHSVDTQVWEFSHPKFLRGRPDLLDEIRRKALDSEHARVEARDLQYSVSVSHMQLRQQVDEQQFRLEEMFELNMLMRQHMLGLRDTLAGVLDWIKNNSGGQLPFDNRLQGIELPATPVFHSFMVERPPPPWIHPPTPASAGPSSGGLFPSGPGDLSGDGPSIYVTEPGFGQQPASQSSQHDVFGMGGLGSVSPIATGSRRVSQSGSPVGDRPMHRMTIDTSMGGNPGLGVMGLPGEMQMAVNTPLPPSPGLAMHSHPGTGAPNTPYGGMENSPFMQSPSISSFPPQLQQQQQPGANPMSSGGYFMSAGSQSNGNGMPMSTMGNVMPSGSAISDEDGSAMLMGPNAKAMRTPLKRTASNSGQPIMSMPSPQPIELNNVNMQKRKVPGA